MRKKQINGIPKEKLDAMTVSQRWVLRRDIEKDRLAIVKEIEGVLADISKKRVGKPLQISNPKKLGRRPNDVWED